jgi:hypothetical protein
MGVSASPITIVANPSQEPDPQAIQYVLAHGNRSARSAVPVGGKPEFADRNAWIAEFTTVCGVNPEIDPVRRSRVVDFTTVCGANWEFLTTRSSSGEFTSRPALERRTPARSILLCSAAAVAGPVTAQRVRRAARPHTIATNETAQLGDARP